MPKDAYGVEYNTYSGQAPTAGSPIIIHNSDGSKSHGFWTGQASN